MKENLLIKMITENKIRKIIREEIINAINEAKEEKKSLHKKSSGILPKVALALSALFAPLQNAFAEVPSQTSTKSETKDSQLTYRQYRTMLDECIKKATEGKKDGHLYAQIQLNFAEAYFKNKIPKDAHLIELFKETVLFRFFDITLKKNVKSSEDLQFVADGLFKRFTQRNVEELQKAADKSTSKDKKGKIGSAASGETKFYQYNTSDLTPEQKEQYIKDSERLKAAMKKLGVTH